MLFAFVPNEDPNPPPDLFVLLPKMLPVFPVCAVLVLKREPVFVLVFPVFVFPNRFPVVEPAFLFPNKLLDVFVFPNKLVFALFVFTPEFVFVFPNKLPVVL